MGMRNMLILTKEDKKYLCRIVEYNHNSSKIKLQILGENTLRYCNLYQNDTVRVEVPMGENFSYFETKILYRDKIDHYLTIEKPLEGMVDNRRKNKRIDVHMKLKITRGNSEVAKSETLMGDDDSNAVIFDISYGGLGVFASYHFSKGDELVFSFSLPNGDELEDIKGFVMSARHSDYENINKYGLQFESLNEQQRVLLEEFIRKYSHDEDNEEVELLDIKER